MKCPACGKSRYRIQKAKHYNFDDMYDPNKADFDEDSTDSVEKVHYECLECGHTWVNE